MENNKESELGDYNRTLDKTKYTDNSEHETLRTAFLGKDEIKNLPTAEDVINSIKNVGKALRLVHRKTFEKEKELGLEEKLRTADNVVVKVFNEKGYVLEGNFKEYYTALAKIKGIMDDYKEGVLELVKIQKVENPKRPPNLAQCLATPDEWWGLESFLSEEVLGKDFGNIINDLTKVYKELHKNVSVFFEKKWHFEKITNIWEEYVLLSSMEEANISDSAITGIEVSSSEFDNIKQYFKNAKFLSEGKSNPYYLVSELLNFIKSTWMDIKKPVEEFRKMLYEHNGCGDNYNQIEELNLEELKSFESIDYKSKVKKGLKGIEKEVEERRYKLLKDIIREEWGSNENAKKIIKFRVENTPWRVYPVLELVSSPFGSQLIAYKGDAVHTDWDDLIGIDNFKNELDEYMPLFLSGKTHRRTILLHGPPGTGKTSGMAAAAKKYGFKVVNVKSANAIWAAMNAVSDLDGHFVIMLDDMPDVEESTEYEALQEFQSLLTSAGGIKEIPENVAIAIALNIKKDKKLDRRLVRRFALKLEFPLANDDTIKKIYRHYFEKYGYIEFEDDSFKTRIDDETIDLGKLAKESRSEEGKINLLSPAEAKLIVDRIVEKKCAKQDEMIEIVKSELESIGKTSSNMYS